MSGHAYLSSVLDDQTLRDGEVAALRYARDTIEDQLRGALSSGTRFFYGGSYAKETMVRVAYDLDLVVYFPHDCGLTVQAIYNQVHRALRAARLPVRTRTVALRIPYEGGFHIDVVPGRAQDGTFRYATLFVNEEPPTRLQTSLKVHIESVKDAGLSDIVRLVKIWALRHSLGMETFPLEIAVQRAMRGVRRSDLESEMMVVLQWLADEFPSARLEDPANSNNVVEVDNGTRSFVAAAARRAWRAPSWSDVVW